RGQCHHHGVGLAEPVERRELRGAQRLAARVGDSAAMGLEGGARPVTHAGSSDPHELKTILLEPYGCGTSPCIDPIFGPTASNRYWSSSLSVPYAVQEWAVEVPERRCGAPSPGIQRLGPGGASRLVIGRYSNHLA